MLAYNSEPIKEYTNHTLSLIISKDSFFYGIFKLQDTAVLQEFDYISLSKVDPFEFEKSCLAFLNKKGLSKKPFKEVHVSFFDSRFTLIHESMFVHGEENAYLRNVLSEYKQHKTKSRYIYGSEHWCVHTLAGFMENNILSLFPQASFSHIVMDMLQLLFKKQINHGLCIYLLENSLLIAAVHKSKLQFVNFYDIASKEDVLYHVLHAFKKAELDPDKDVFVYSGDLTTESDLFKLLYDYIRNIEKLQIKSKGPVQQKIFLR